MRPGLRDLWLGQILHAMISLPRLYAIVDSSAHESTQGLVAYAEELVAAGCTLLQYRNKSGNARVMLEQARELRERLGSHSNAAENAALEWGTLGSVRLIMNDRADLCLAAEFDGVHVGQDDLSPESVRAIIGPERWLGVSTHNPEQLREADLTSADYLGDRAGVRHVQQRQARSRGGPRRCAAGAAVDPQAAGGHRRHHPGECRVRDRGRGRFRGGDIRSVTGATQISRGIFPHSEVKFSGIASIRFRVSS